MPNGDETRGDWRYWAGQVFPPSRIMFPDIFAPQPTTPAMAGRMWGETAQLTPRTEQIMAGQPYQQFQESRMRQQLGLPEPTPPQAPAPQQDPFAQRGAPAFPKEKAPEGYDWRWDSASMRYVLTPRPGAARISQAEIRKIELAEQEAEREEAFRQQQFQWQQQQAEMQQQWQREQMQSQMQMQQEQMAFQQEQAQMQQQEQERQYAAQLSAQPRSWLEYGAYTGETPVVQPWMLPLMSQQYEGTVAGAPLPGWQGGTSMAQLPELTRPSRQYQARMGPTGMQQYLGYQQAMTGARPEETQFRQWATAPPGGRFGGMQWTR